MNLFMFVAVLLISIVIKEREYCSVEERCKTEKKLETKPQRLFR